MIDHNKNINIIKDDIPITRDEWRRVRSEKLTRKSDLVALGYDKRKIRKDKIYKKLRKEQDRLSKLLRHAEKRVNRVVPK